MRAVAQRVRRDPAFIANFTSAELATTAWAYATLGVRDEALLGILADVAVRRGSPGCQNSLCHCAFCTRMTSQGEGGGGGWIWG